MTIHFWRSASHPHISAFIADVVSLVGLVLFLWVITTDLLRALDERASLPDPVMVVGPLLFILGFLTSLAIYTRRIGLRWWGAPPVLVLAALVVMGANLDLLPLTAALLGVGLVPVGLAHGQRQTPMGFP